jgi:hypothetical protein
MKIEDKGFKGHKHVIEGGKKTLGKSLQAEAIRLLQPITSNTY